MGQSDMGQSVRRLRSELGGIDIYLLDQLLRGHIEPGMRLFDAGCGGGRNLRYFLAAGYEVMGADREEASIEAVRALAARLAPRLPVTHFRCEPLEGLTFADHSADVVICNAVLHLAHTDEQFQAMLRGSWSVLAPGGLFFARLASTIGMEDRFRSIDGRWCELPDGSERYLVDEELLLELTDELGGELLDPIKTTVVQDMRCMTTWVLRKGVGT
jgi:SAM-dependent methyltransferase